MATPTAVPSNTVPALSAERAVNWPRRVKAKLSNGLELVLIESHTIPRFNSSLYFRSGNAAVSHLAPGLADMTAAAWRRSFVKLRSGHERILLRGVERIR